MSLRYTPEEYLEIEQRLNNNRFKEFQKIEDEDAPESELAKKIRKHCKENGLPCLIFPQTPDVKKFLPPGWPDGTILLKNWVLFLELKKVKGGRKSKAQKEMALLFAFLGNPIHECKTYKRFIELLYGKG